ncbi:hypothetical protein SCHPADRAFT_594708 [Schizopora paradoxa]|uniref:Uncharacterized protein n=1 Tax=Schizopora paradoxa TaxID=27342 RepID=A0A0H2RVE3_9AGAM|nr:hypothetical protein SCHPADRAFT_594708 [Schizopora paradoxa]
MSETWRGSWLRRVELLFERLGEEVAVVRLAQASWLSSLIEGAVRAAPVENRLAVSRRIRECEAGEVLLDEGGSESGGESGEFWRERERSDELALVRPGTEDDDVLESGKDKSGLVDSREDWLLLASLGVPERLRCTAFNGTPGASRSQWSPSPCSLAGALLATEELLSVASASAEASRWCFFFASGSTCERERFFASFCCTTTGAWLSTMAASEAVGSTLRTLKGSKGSRALSSSRGSIFVKGMGYGERKVLVRGRRGASVVDGERPFSFKYYSCIRPNPDIIIINATIGPRLLANSLTFRSSGSKGPHLSDPWTPVTPLSLRAHRILPN